MFDLGALGDAVCRHGKVARLVIAEISGSSPREIGAAMLVWADPQAEGGQSGTIGGGAFEWQAIARARDLLARGETLRFERIPLGPALGQCCGGAVSLLTEVYDASALAALAQQEIIARPVRPEASTRKPFVLRRLHAEARGKGILPEAQLLQGWMIEPIARPKQHIWIWGAGHVGRAMIATLAPLPDLHLTWLDTSRERFPAQIPAQVTPIWAEHPEQLAPHAPANSLHLIVTYSHALDLELCHRLLNRGVEWIGLIGSQTKWARFRGRLMRLGHRPVSIDRIECPIGDPELGKHPQAIAVGVAVHLLKRNRQSEAEIADDNWHDDSRDTLIRDRGINQDLPRRGRQ